MVHRIQGKHHTQGMIEVDIVLGAAADQVDFDLEVAVDQEVVGLEMAFGQDKHQEEAADLEDIDQVVAAGQEDIDLGAVVPEDIVLVEDMLLPEAGIESN